MSDAEGLICAEVDRTQRAAEEFWQGDVQLAITAICRALDMCAVGLRWGHADTASAHYRLLGGVDALSPFAARAAEIAGGIPWGPSRASEMMAVYRYLDTCGKLAHLRRFAAMERFGLAEVRVLAANKITIRVQGGSAELAFRAAHQTLVGNHESEIFLGGETPERRRRRIVRCVTKYVDSDSGWFIRYDNDMKLVREYRRDAKFYGRRYLEREAFPDDVKLGNRTFGQWSEACDQALGRILCHTDFAAALVRKRPGVDLYNVLTIFARREDVAAVWEETGMPASHVDATMDALTLGPQHLDEWRKACEPPTHYYVGVGKDFVLLPCFGALTNPYYSLFRHLRNVFRSDWDKSVDRREDVFRDNLAALLPPDRFVVQNKGYKLRRSDGSVATDIDAVAIDRTNGRVALFQLKWHDVYGRSPSERESRKRNMAAATAWVDTLARTLGGYSSRDVCKRLGIPSMSSDLPPVLIVLARYMARFSGDGEPDPRATWLSWPEFQLAFNSAIPDDALASVGSKVDEYRSSFDRTDGPPRRETFIFPGLSIDLETQS